MSLKEQVYKNLTGTKTPDRQRLKEALIVAVVFSLLNIVLGMFIQYSVTKTFLEKTDVEFTLGTFDKDEIGYYFPLKVTNSGQKNLQEMYVKFNNCYMDRTEEYKIDRLIATASETIKLRDNKTSSLYTKRPCNPDFPFSMEDCRIKSYKINSTHLYVPVQYCSIFMCDFCKYEATINSKDPEISKSFNGSFYAPKEIKLKITPNQPISLGNQTLIKEMYPIGMNFFNEQELCIWDGKCFAHNFKVGPYLPELPGILTICPTENLTCMNVTINYEAIPKFSRYS